MLQVLISLPPLSFFANHSVFCHYFCAVTPGHILEIRIFAIINFILGLSDCDVIFLSSLCHHHCFHQLFVIFFKNTSLSLFLCTLCLPTPVFMFFLFRFLSSLMTGNVSL